MTRHLLRMGGIAALAALCIIYPFLPGSYDALAMPLSTMAQGAAALAGVFVVPIGVVWLAFEARGRHHRFGFAVASVAASSLVAVAVALIALASVGASLALPVFALWLYALSRLMPRLARLRQVPRETFDHTPLYLVVVPLVVLLFQLGAAARATEMSRKRAIAGAAELIRDIDSYRARHGQLPASLLGVWKDYKPSVVGVEKFHFAPNGAAYDLFFEQPRFLLDDLGTREFVVYNARDEQMMVSHTAWVLSFSPEQLRRNQGWYAVHDGPSPRWKTFWFD